MLLTTSKEYKDFNGINQSRLKLIENPTLFKNIRKEDDEDGEPEYFKFGTFIDDLLLDEDIQDKYISLPNFKLPPPEVKKVFDDYIKTHENLRKDFILYEDDLATLAKDSGVYATYKHDTIIAKLKKHDEYFYLAIDSQNKIVLDSEQFGLGTYITTILRNQDRYSKFYVDSNGIENRKKIRIAVDYPLQTSEGQIIISLKGELDSLQIDHNNKTYSVVDDKTTGDLYGFKHSIFKYRYDFQLAFYNFLVSLSLKELGLEGYSSSGKSYLIAIGSKYMLPPLIFELPVKMGYNSYSLGSRNYIGVVEALDRYAIHYNSNIWDLPTEMILNDVIPIMYEG